MCNAEETMTFTHLPGVSTPSCQPHFLLPFKSIHCFPLLVFHPPLVLVIE